MRGEKRPAASTQMVVLENGGQVLANGSGEPPIKKAAVDRLPEFDWAANNYELTWKLVEQLRKEEHRKVVFPEQEIPRVRKKRNRVQNNNWRVSINLVRITLATPRRMYTAGLRRRLCTRHSCRIQMSVHPAWRTRPSRKFFYVQKWKKKLNFGISNGLL